MSRIETVLAERQQLLSAHYRDTNSPQSFTCPACLKSEQIFMAWEELQVCKTCRSFHKSDILILDGWTL